MFAQRRNLVAMHEAGMLFRAWGVALGKKLEQVLAKKRKKMLPSIEEEGAKPIVVDEEEVEEDFLDEGQLYVCFKIIFFKAVKGLFYLVSDSLPQSQTKETRNKIKIKQYLHCTSISAYKKTGQTRCLVVLLLCHLQYSVNVEN